MVDIAELVSAFQRKFAGIPRLFHAPGRVNLIGEHTDYNNGFVLPMAIDRGTTVAVRVRPDKILQVFSINLNDSIELDLNKLGSGLSGSWSDYVEGMAAALIDRGISLSGADIALKSDLSIGGGLSSSAALEISLGMALLSVSGGSLDKRSLAFAGQTAEHRHVGIKCGIMDQFASIFAQRNHAILLDCRSLDAVSVPLHLPEYRILICDSRVRHALASSEYNRRRQDCESGVIQLRAVLPGIRSLRDISFADFETYHSVLTPEVMRRCRHVISENSRTLRAVEALTSGDALEVGKLMSASHNSLRDDFQVSCSELDLLVEIALAQPGVLGARMTGGGFGGCTVNLVYRERVQEFREKITREYQAKTKIRPDVFVAEASDGAKEISPAATHQQPKSRRQAD